MGRKAHPWTSGSCNRIDHPSEELFACATASRPDSPKVTTETSDAPKACNPAAKRK